MEVMLRGAAGSVQGRALSVQPDGLRIDVEKLLDWDFGLQFGEVYDSVQQYTCSAMEQAAHSWTHHWNGHRFGDQRTRRWWGPFLPSEGGDIGAQLTAISVSAVAAGYGIGWMADRGDYTTIYIQRK